MKLDHALLALATCALFVGGCAGGAAPRQASMPEVPVVGTTHLRAADLGAADDAPRVGKSRRSQVGEAVDLKDESDEKAFGHRVDRKHAGFSGGGFSGYK